MLILYFILRGVFKMKYWLALSIVLLSVASCIEEVGSSVLYQYDQANKAGKVTEEIPASLSKIDLTSEDGNRVFGWYFDGAEKNAPVVMFFHGNGSNLQTLLDSGFIERLKNLKVNFGVFDYPKYGLSTGEPSEKTVIADSQVVYDFLKQKFPNSKFILWGRSLGCAPATIMAEKNSSGVSKLILTSPWTSFWKLVKFKTNWSDSESHNAAVGNEYETEIHAQNIKMPVLIHHGTIDKVVPWDMGKNLSQVFSDATFISMEGLDHQTVISDKLLEDAFQFIRE
jgi:alpha-beta hydrolase superfamily lysophospholipase